MDSSSKITDLGASVWQIWTEWFRNPALLVIVSLFYVMTMATTYLYLEQKRQADRLDLELESQRHRIQSQRDSLEQQRQLLAEQLTLRKPIDIFKKLSFNEKVEEKDTERLQAALSLNSFAKFALQNQDLDKARDTLNESMKVYPTLEAQYYLGVLAYVKGDNEQAITWWRKISDSSTNPNDVLLYLSVAEYRAGNTNAAQNYAQKYWETRMK